MRALMGWLQARRARAQVVKARRRAAFDAWLQEHLP